VSSVTRTLAGVLLVLLVVAAGCGGGKKAQAPASQATTTSPAVSAPPERVTLGKKAYDQAMKGLGRQLVGSVDGLFPLVEARPGSEVSRESLVKLRKTRAVVRRVTAKVARIAPPAAIRTEHRQLLQGLSALRGELDQLIDVEEHGTSKPFGEFAQFKSLRTIAKARTAIEKKGYQIG
jgi:hypothetical protein